MLEIKSERRKILLIHSQYKRKQSDESKLDKKLTAKQAGEEIESRK